MAPPLSLANMLAVLIFVSWTNLRSYASPDGHYLDIPENPFDTRPQVENTLNVVKEIMTVLKESMDAKEYAETVVGFMRGVSKFASAMPFVGPVFAGINMLMVFIPQHDPVFREVTEGFKEVNRKLDSLSMQISNLATDVEWFNYASVYSQDEVRILGAWRNYETFFKDGNSSNINYLTFLNYYEYTQVEASVFNLYHYLTVRDTSLSINLNHLLRNKFKCDLKKILSYNFYFSSLLMKGVALNNFYWNLIGYNTTGKETEHTQMFQDVLKAQSETVDICLNNHMEYVKDDVVAVAKSVGSDNLRGIAEKVRGFLDDKYDFYRWVVLVYKKSKETGEYIDVYDTMTKIPINEDVIVAITYTKKADIPQEELAKLLYVLDSCDEGGSRGCFLCLTIDKDRVIHSIGLGTFTMNVVKYTKTTHKIYDESDFAESPSPNKTVKCTQSYTTAVHYSRTLSPCDEPNAKCQNNGRCKRLADSNEALCECRDGFYGDMCEKKVDIDLLPDVVKRPLSIVKTASVRLANIETNLNEMHTNTRVQLENIVSKLKEIQNSISTSGC